MATVKITDSLYSQMVNSSRKQFEAAARRASENYHNLIVAALRARPDAAVACVNREWGEHVHLKKQMPLQWMKTPEYLSLYVKGPSLTNGYVRMWMEEEPEDEAPISLAGFSWSPTKAQPEKEEQPRIPVSRDQFAYDSTYEARHHYRINREELLSYGIPQEEYALPPNAYTSSFKMMLDLDELCPDHSQRIAMLRAIDDQEQIERRCDKAVEGLKVILTNLPTINRVLKEYPQLEPLIPKEVLARVRTKAARSIRSASPVPTAKRGPTADELAALNTVSALTGLN